MTAVHLSEYSGQALQAFVLGLPSDELRRNILQQFGLTAIEAEQWYPMETARGIFYAVRDKVGDAAMFHVGKQMIEISLYYGPDPQTAEESMLSLVPGFEYNVRNIDVSQEYVQVELHEGEDAATVTYHTRWPCSFLQGVIAGCIVFTGGLPLIEHVAGGCMDSGAKQCRYSVRW